MVNWMHGASHNQRCQVQNNGRHQPGSGWRYGKQCKQLWSMLKRDREGTTCKETRRKAKAQARKLLQAKEKLLSMAEWQVLGTSQQAASVRIPETVISSMVSGSAPPWAEDAASSMARTLHHGKRYFQLYSDQERIAEQQIILRQDLRRLQAWLRSMLEACTRSSAEQNPGQRFYVEQHKAWFASKLEHASQLQWEA
ncbi:hypothetical protein QJQ45_011081 [Haematococcus lacustris]|nr:hypothetical protein QJQ45_011081 [Haematococcus lacustris]